MQYKDVWTYDFTAAKLETHAAQGVTGPESYEIEVEIKDLKKLKEQGEGAARSKEGQKQGVTAAGYAATALLMKCHGFVCPEKKFNAQEAVKKYMLVPGGLMDNDGEDLDAEKAPQVEY